MIRTLVLSFGWSIDVDINITCELKVDNICKCVFENTNVKLTYMVSGLRFFSDRIDEDSCIHIYFMTQIIQWSLAFKMTEGSE